MNMVRIAAVCAAFLALSASGASAQQAGYVFLQCEFTGKDAGSSPPQFRIGNGRWDQLVDGAWRYAGGSDCGGERTTAEGAARTHCTFGENEYRMATSYYRQEPTTTTRTISRVTGSYRITERKYPPSRPGFDMTVQCQPIAEPKTP
ncbi:hypothetical protein AQ619_12985 [Caulobacter henricii]|uniref:Uncharacterized protein n=1 Tax=Caulobacter henricii TaxID=69395 RepID=A0A0P0P110_9CAUL|nr:hypothetical protein AQ619_12985 [Caulobacter henricii]